MIDRVFIIDLVDNKTVYYTFDIRRILKAIKC